MRSETRSGVALGVFPVRGREFGAMKCITSQQRHSSSDVPLQMERQIAGDVRALNTISEENSDGFPFIVSGLAFLGLTIHLECPPK